MGTIKKFEDLELWQVARELARKVKRLTETEQFSKHYRFRDQKNAAAGSVMDNIAEGFERSSRLEFVNFLSISKGSTGEVHSQLYRAVDYCYLKEDEVLPIIQEYESSTSRISGFITI